MQQEVGTAAPVQLSETFRICTEPHYCQLQQLIGFLLSGHILYKHSHSSSHFGCKAECLQPFFLYVTYSSRMEIFCDVKNKITAYCLTYYSNSVLYRYYLWSPLL